MGHSRPLIRIFWFFSSNFYTIKTVEFSGIRTQIVGLDLAGHLTTSTAPFWLHFEQRICCYVSTLHFTPLHILFLMFAFVLGFIYTCVYEFEAHNANLEMKQMFLMYTQSFSEGNVYNDVAPFNKKLYRPTVTILHIL